MAYSASVYRLLVSCPRDVPATDLAIVGRAVARWNVSYGPKFSAVVLPVWWNEHAAAEFGQPPQAILNRQIVDDCDMCVAIFANRLGTPSHAAESGTVEEIQRFVAHGKYVGILRSRRPVDPATIDTKQIALLNDYLAGIQPHGLTLDYESDMDLSERVQSILAAGVSREQLSVELQLRPPDGEPSSGAEVWARVDSRDRLRRYVSRPPTVGKHWFLVLSNTGTSSATDVKCSMAPTSEEKTSWTVLGQVAGETLSVGSIAPHEESSFHILIDSNTPRQVECTVSWSDERGRQERSAMLSLA